MMNIKQEIRKIEIDEFRLEILNKHNISIYYFTSNLRESRQATIYIWFKDKDIESFIIIDDDLYLYKILKIKY